MERERGDADSEAAHASPDLRGRGLGVLPTRTVRPTWAPLVDDSLIAVSVRYPNTSTHWENEAKLVSETNMNSHGASSAGWEVADGYPSPLTVGAGQYAGPRQRPGGAP